MPAFEKFSFKRKEKLKTPRLYSVILLNDDWTPMDFVVMVLKSVFAKTEEAAFSIMMSVHKGGSAVAGVYTEDIARTKGREVLCMAEKEGYPLSCIVEVARQC